MAEKDTVKPLTDEELEASAARVNSRSQTIPKRIKKLRNRAIIGKAAAILLIASLAIFYALSHKDNAGPGNNDVPPGRNLASLTFSNGAQVQLSDQKKFLVIGSDELIYNDGQSVLAGRQKNWESVEVSTPKGGTYQVVLPDGTVVWLNSASSVSFSSDLHSSHRRILKFTGEIFLEVARDSSRPFLAICENQTVTVLGTKFNVNAYQPDSIQTTLIEGKVSLKSLTSQSQTLFPGQQAITRKGRIDIKPVDVDLQMAWKNGKIQFEKEDLNSIMMKLARWYDIEPVYRYYPADSQFTGSISRYRTLTEVLKLLESTEEVHFTIKGRRVIVER